MNLAGLEPSSKISGSMECCIKRMEGNKEPLPGHADIIHDIHFYAAVSNWLMLSICIYLMMCRICCDK